MRPSAAQIRGHSAAFSLLELLLVIGLIVILTTLFWGRSRPDKGAAALAMCQRNLEKVFIAAQIYANDSGGRFPVATGALSAEDPLDLLVPRYASDTGLFVCPGQKPAPAPTDSLRKGRISYAYVMGRSAQDVGEVLLTDAQVDTLAKGQGQAAFSLDGKPPGNNHANAGGNLLFGDGHVDASKPRIRAGIALPAGVVLLNPKPEKP